MMDVTGRRCQTRDGLIGEIRVQDDDARLYHVFWDIDGGYSGEWIEMGDVELMEPTNQKLDAALALLKAFKEGDVKAFNYQCSMLQTMTGRALFNEGWAKRWTIKNLADGIVMRESGHLGSGNSGTH